MSPRDLKLRREDQNCQLLLVGRPQIRFEIIKRLGTRALRHGVLYCFQVRILVSATVNTIFGTWPGRSYTENVIVPMQPSNVAEPFSDSHWLFEPKWDRYCAIRYYAESRVRFISRRNNDLTKRFPELQTIDLRADSAIIDGEIVAIDDDGVPCF